MRKLIMPVLIILMIAGCKNSAPDYSGTAHISGEDFLKAFPVLNLPVTIYDSTLQNFGDTLEINKSVFGQFVPDSALNKFLSNLKNEAVIHPAGIIHKKERDFILATFSSAKKIHLGVFVLDDKHKFLASLPLLNNYEDDKYIYSTNITEEPTFILKEEKFTTGNTFFYNRNGFAYSAATNSFLQVLHDSNEDTAKNNEVINPIDTLSSKNKLSGDYVKDKKNFIAVRDGKNANTYAFFIHFEKNNGDCVGELKGTMTMTDEKNAVFTESGDPCVINFKFSGNSIKIKEQDNCGNHRGITCLFDFTFQKKKIQPKEKATHEK